jgi:hypothetical protein
MRMGEPRGLGTPRQIARKESSNCAWKYPSAGYRVISNGRQLCRTSLV